LKLQVFRVSILPVKLSNKSISNADDNFLLDKNVDYSYKLQHYSTQLNWSIMDSLTLYAPAKINYLLDVIAKRPDGYHDLRMIMQRVDLCDEVTIKLSEVPGINVLCGSKGVPDGPGNIAWKAAKSLLDLTDSRVGIDISIIKNIPVGAGLGGGSSDAASVLMGVNELLHLGLTDQKLMEIGCKLGADVPFFIFKKTALAEGIGEKLTPLNDPPKCWILLVNSGIHVSTAWVYRSLQLTNTGNLNKLPEFFGSIEQLVSIMSNDLESVTIPAFPVISEIKSRLIDLGAIGSMMSGSGPTVFAVFKSFETAEKARLEVTKGTSWFSRSVETL
jgi:4-diphosphocytidyl-2-C-methyl-D-erythritol kinase